MMHRIGIISDTHGLLRPEVAEILKGCDAILHGGDINKPEILNELNDIAPTYVVRGNNDKDWAKDLPESISVNLYGINLYMVHIKKYVPKDLEDVDIVVYGHSHKYEEKHVGGRLRLNPGSCGPRRFTQPITFAILEICDDGTYQAEKIEIAHKPGGTKTGEAKTSGIKSDGAKTDEEKTSGIESDGGETDTLEQEIAAHDMKKIVKAVMRDTNRKLSVEEMAAKNGISEELAEQICRLYLTHPGVSADGILSKMGL